MNILGISAFYHDSAACLVKDGIIIAAAQEERFTRKKHDHTFPSKAIQYCLREADIDSTELDYVAFYDKPFLKFERILETYLTYAPFGISSFLKAIPLWIKKKLWIKEIIKEDLNYSGKIIFSEHHESHAASAFFPSPYQEAAFITMDGVGEWSTSSFGIGKGNQIELLADIQFPHSLGLLYSAFTYYTGFKINSGEYKIMGLAPYGEQKYKELIYEHLIDVKDDIHLANQFDAAYHDIDSGEVLELQVTLSGLSQGVAMAKLRIFARANSSVNHSVDLPIEVTGEEWPGMNSHSESTDPPDISFINGLLDDLAIWLTANTPWKFDRMQAGIILLIGSGLLVGTVRRFQAQNAWQRNMDKKTRDDRVSEARFDEIRRGGGHQHHIEQGIPESPEFVIRRKGRE